MSGLCYFKISSVRWTCAHSKASRVCVFCVCECVASYCSTTYCSISYLCIHQSGTQHAVWMILLVVHFSLSLPRSLASCCKCDAVVIVYLSISISQSASQPVIDRRFAWNQYWFIAHVHSSVCSTLNIHFFMSMKSNCVSCSIPEKTQHIVKQKHRFVVWLIKKTCQNKTSNNKRMNKWVESEETLAQMRKKKHPE